MLALTDKPATLILFFFSTKFCSESLSIQGGYIDILDILEPQYKSHTPPTAIGSVHSAPAEMTVNGRSMTLISPKRTCTGCAGKQVRLPEIQMCSLRELKDVFLLCWTLIPEEIISALVVKRRSVVSVADQYTQDKRNVSEKLLQPTKQYG